MKRDEQACTAVPFHDGLAEHLTQIARIINTELRKVLAEPFRVQPVSLHQNVCDTGGFKQHAAVGNDNQDLLHVLKSTFNTE